MALASHHLPDGEGALEDLKGMTPLWLLQALRTEGSAGPERVRAQIAR